MFEYETFTTGAPPRTGNHWLEAGLRACGHTPIGTIPPHSPEGIDGKPRITMLREPAGWLASHYMNTLGIYGLSPGLDRLNQCAPWPPPPAAPLPRRYRAPLFEEFVHSYLERMPGAVSAIFEEFDSELKVRLDHAAADLCDVLDWLELKHDIEAIRAVGVIRGGSNRKAAWPKVLRQSFLAFEEGTTA
jgi:hypothetical protein